MNPNYKEFKFPQIKAHPWNKVFRTQTPTEAIDLISNIIEYTPTSRPSPQQVSIYLFAYSFLLFYLLKSACFQACLHAFFNELRDPETKLPNGKPLPHLETDTTPEPEQAESQ